MFQCSTPNISVTPRKRLHLHNRKQPGKSAKSLKTGAVEQANLIKRRYGRSKQRKSEPLRPLRVAKCTESGLPIAQAPNRTKPQLRPPALQGLEVLPHTSGGSTGHSDDYQVVAELHGIKHLLRQVVDNQSKIIRILSNRASNEQNTGAHSSTPLSSTPRMALAPVPTAMAENPSEEQLVPVSEVLEDVKWLNPIYVTFNQKINEVVWDLASKAFFGHSVLLANNVRSGNGAIGVLDQQKLWQINSLIREKFVSELGECDWLMTWEKAKDCLQVKIKYLQKEKLCSMSSLQIIRQNSYLD